MRGPYHLLLLSLLSLSGYLLTWSLVKTGIISKQFHRRIWNVVLLISFLISGILGMLLVVQLNYKLEWEFMKPLMVWHVDAGIVLTLVAVFHFLWHSSYYLNLFKKKQNHGGNFPDPISPDVNPREITWMILALGFFTTVVQVLMIREITTVFQGNELMIGWTMGIWMFLTGAGTWLGRSFRRNKPLKILFGLFILLAYLPPLLALGLNLIRNLMFPPGELVNPLWFLALILLFLSPVCMLSGFTWSMLVSFAGFEERKFIKVYAFESLGSLAGGIVVSFLLIRWLGIVQSMLLTALLIHIVVGYYRLNFKLILSSILLAGLFVFCFVFQADLKIKSLLFPNQKIIISQETSFGNVTVTENGGEFSFYENGAQLFSTGDLIIHEEFVHYAMLQHPHPENVLLVSGGIAGMADEILKYPDVERIDLLELNPEIIRLAKTIIPFPTDQRINVIKDDGRRFLQRTSSKYDVAVFAIPDPSSLQINRFYTSEFLHFLKQKLNKNAVVLFGISPSGNYLSPEKANLESAIYHTLSANFKNVVIIPGERDYFVASDSMVTEKAGTLATLKEINATWVNQEYLDDESISQRSESIRKNIEPLIISNSDIKPLPVFYHSLQFLSRFFGNNLYAIAIPVFLLLLPLFLMNSVSGGMYITGFTASSVEIILIFWFQTFLGNVYAALGVIFAVFMGGLALGSMTGYRFKTSRKHHIAGQIMLAVFVLFLPILWKSGSLKFSDPVAWILFIPVLLIPSFLTGFQYVTSTLRYHSDQTYSASAIYASDLWGSALGAILITIILIPFFGVNTTCLMLAGLNGLSALFLLLSKTSK
jgi:spermidine synthase